MTFKVNSFGSWTYCDQHLYSRDGENHVSCFGFLLKRNVAHKYLHKTNIMFCVTRLHPVQLLAAKWVSFNAAGILLIPPAALKILRRPLEQHEKGIRGVPEKEKTVRKYSPFHQYKFSARSIPIVLQYNILSHWSTMLWSISMNSKPSWSKIKILRAFKAILHFFFTT